MFKLLSTLLLLVGSITEPPRVVSLAPSLTQIIQSLGVEPVGVSDFCKTKDAVRLGGLTNPNIEALIRLKSTHVFVLGDHNGLKSKLHQLGIIVNGYSNNTIAEIHDSMIEIGAAIGKKDKAEELVSESKLKLTNLNRSKSYKSFLLIVAGEYPRNLIAAGNSSIYGDIFKAIGITNAYQGSFAYPELSIEGVISLNADKIVFLQGDSQKNFEISQISKFINKTEIQIVNEPGLLVPGANIADLANKLSEYFHE